MPGSNLSSLTNLLFTKVLLRQCTGTIFSLQIAATAEIALPTDPYSPTHSLPPKYFLSPLRLNLRTFIHSCLGANALELFSLCRSPRPQRPHFPPTPIPPTHRLPPNTCSALCGLTSALSCTHAWPPIPWNFFFSLQIAATAETALPTHRYSTHPPSPS